MLVSEGGLEHSAVAPVRKTGAHAVIVAAPAPAVRCKIARWIGGNGCVLRWCHSEARFVAAANWTITVHAATAVR